MENSKQPYTITLVLPLQPHCSVETFTEDEFEGRAGQEDVQFEFRFTSDISPESQLLMNSLVLGLRNIEKDYGKSYINVKYKEV